MHKTTLIIIAIVLSGCGESICPGEWDEHIVSEVLACSQGTGGYGGVDPKCRVSFYDGGRATVRPPTAVDDTYVSKGSCIWLKGTRYTPMYSGQFTPQ